jgi:hypothetical protein
MRSIHVKGKSLLSEVGLSTTTYTVVSPNTYKLITFLLYIGGFALDNDLGTPGFQTETSCLTAIENKLDSFCKLDITDSTCPDGKTKVFSAQCAYGSGVPDDYIKCKTLNDQF